MATRVASRVYISDTLVVKAMNEGGSGGVADDLNKTMKRVRLRAVMTSPVNNPMDATHRGGGVGTYSRSFKRHRWGNGKLILRGLYNDAPHAVIVEKGRRSTSFAEMVWAMDVWPGHYITNKDGTRDFSTRYTYWAQGGMHSFGKQWERFGWKGARVPGSILWYAGTRGRAGQHVLENAFTLSTRKYISVGVVRGKVYRVGAIVPPRFGPGGFAG